jgi:hypothetical protein
LKYTDGFLFRRWYRDLPTDTYRRYICRWVFEIPTENISVCKFVGNCGSYCQMLTDSFRR